MSFRTSFIVPLLEHLLRRPVQLDPDIPARVLLGRSLAVAVGLLRGMVLIRRRIVLESGARIGDARRFRTSGGLVRIGAMSRVDCTSRDGIVVGRNFKLGAYSRMIASGTPI